MPRPGRPRRGPSRGQLARRRSVPYRLLGLLQSPNRALPRFKKDEAVALGLARVAIGDDVALVDVAVGLEGQGQGLAGCVPAEAEHEYLAVGDVGVGRGVDAAEDFGVVQGGVDDEVDELVLGVGLEEALDVVGIVVGVE